MLYLALIILIVTIIATYILIFSSWLFDSFTVVNFWWGLGAIISMILISDVLTKILAFLIVYYEKPKITRNAIRLLTSSKSIKELENNIEKVKEQIFNSVFAEKGCNFFNSSRLLDEESINSAIRKTAKKLECNN